MNASIPRIMRAVVLEAYQEDVTAAIEGLRVVDRPVASPRRGQVLVKVEAAPCNPSDLLLMQGKYGTLKTLPSVPGWEGAGTVVASGGGLLAWWLNGKRVAFGVQADRDGTWAQYAIANANECIPLKSKVSFEQGASLIINPLTATGLLDTARRRGHRAAIQTAAASQLGRMLIVMAADQNYTLVKIVRRDEQVELLRSLGAQHILNSSDDDFGEQLQATCERMNVTAAFDSVAGELTGTLINSMPDGATAYVYGGLSEQACSEIDPIGLIFHCKTVTGFYLSQWLRRRGPIGILRAAGRVQQMLIDGRIESKVQRRVPLDQIVDGLKQYVTHMTDGKVLIMPHG